MVTWILEKNVFSESCFDEMIAHFKYNDIPFHTVTIVPFAHTIQGETPKVDGSVVVYGSIGIQTLAKENNWNPGVFYDEVTFRYDSYCKNVGDMMLNNGCEIMPISVVEGYVNHTEKDSFFIKPVGDTKEFAGEVQNRYDFASWYKNMLDIGYLENNDFDVVIADPIKLGREWRVVVVDGKIAAYSIYKQFGIVKPEPTITDEVREFVQIAAQKFNPAPAYVIDIAETFNGLKIIEYNNFNSAGLYACDVGDIIDEINQYVEDNV